MADASNSMKSTTSTNRRNRSVSNSPGQVAPGLVSFSAIMMFLFGGFQLAWAFVEFANAGWISSATYGTFGGRLWLWGLLDVAFALAAFYAGYSLLTGGRFGQIFGLVVAGVSALRWFFYIPSAPAMSIVMIAVAVLIIYGLVANREFFGTDAHRP